MFSKTRCVASIRSKLILACTLITCFTFSNVQAQEITGPSTGEVRDLITLTLEKLPDGVQDLKIICSEHKLGDGYQVFRGFDGTIMIQVFSKIPQTFTFVVAANKDQKTLVTTKTIIIGTPTPVPPGPGPQPGPDPNPGPTTDLAKRFLPFYKVSPNDSARLQMAMIYKTMATTPYTNYQQAGIDLQKRSEPLKEDLKSLRDEIKKYLIEKLGKDTGTQWDQPLFSKTFLEIAQALDQIR